MIITRQKLHAICDVVTRKNLAKFELTGDALIFEEEVNGYASTVVVDLSKKYPQTAMAEK